MIGDLKNRVTIQQLSRTPDEGGGFMETWEDVDTAPDVYAEIVPLSGGEQLRYHQLATTVTHRVTLRYRGDVTPAMRIIKGDTAYNIAVVLDRGGQNMWLDILATVAVP